MDREKIFYQCFSKPMAEYLKNCGNEVLLKAKHHITDKLFWAFLYDVDGKLKKDIKQWSLNNPKK